MTLYRYRAATAQGQVVEESTDASSPDALAALVERRDLTLLSASEDRGDLSTVLPAWRSDRIPTRDLAILSRQMASLLKAGVALDESLASIATQLKPGQGRVLTSIAQKIRTGQSLSEALAKHPETFSPIYLATVAAAERVGALESAFRQLADMLFWERRLRKNLVSAIRYPAMVLAAMAAAMVVLQQIVVPQFGKIFAQLGGDLPLPTRILVGFSSFIGSYWWLLLAGIAGAFVLFRRALATTAGRLRFDALLLVIPLLGPILKHMFLSRFARMTALLYSQGLPIIEAFQVIAGTIGNLKIAREVQAMEAAVSRGQSIAEAVLGQPSFTPMVRNMLRVGETTGGVDEAMTMISEFYDEETSRALADLLQWIEPILTVVLGAFVLFLALAIFLPWWNLTSLYRK